MTAFRACIWSGPTYSLSCTGSDPASAFDFANRFFEVCEAAEEVQISVQLFALATKLMVQTDLNDQEIAEIMGWSQQEVARTRKVYVDQRSAIVAIGQRIDLAAPVRRHICEVPIELCPAL